MDAEEFSSVHPNFVLCQFLPRLGRRWAAVTEFALNTTYKLYNSQPNPTTTLVTIEVHFESSYTFNREWARI
jgi:hypothetical protein